VTPAERRAALELEFVRLKERQDHLDAVLQGDPAAWIRIVERMPDSVGEVTLDKAVAEARQGALAMATILKTLEAGQEEAAAVPAASPADEIRAARERKLKEAAVRMDPPPGIVIHTAP
jgi:superfamily I DNA/RNA helicase